MPDEEELEEEETQEETAAATVATLEPVARWRVHAASDGPQGADGIAELARSAYRNLLAAEWEADESAAAMPVHEFDRDEPRGQAYKAVWGFDAEARAQRSAAGAACYTYRLPDDALDAGNADGVARVVAVRANVAADRYCGAGAYLVALCSDSPTPPSLALFAARAQADGAEAWLATDGQTDASGAPLKPNKRSGGSAFAAAEPAGGLTPGPYLHLCLMLADYLGVRGNWIEGGAMFASEVAEAEFSRAVEPGNAGVPPAALLPLDLGRMDLSGSSALSTALARLPRTALCATWTLQGDGAVLSSLVGADYEAKCRNMLSYLFATPALYAGKGANSILTGSAAELGATGRAGMAVAVADNGAWSVAFCAFAAHGLTRRRVFRGLRLSNPLNAAGSATMPLRVCVYALASPPATDATPRSQTPVPWWGDVLSAAFRGGSAASFRCFSNPATAFALGESAPSVTAAVQGPDATQSASAEALAAATITGECADIRFARPWASPEAATVVVAAIPDGAPAGGDGGSSYDLSVSRSVTVKLPNSGASAATRAERYPSATCTVIGTVRTAETAFALVRKFSSSMMVHTFVVKAEGTPPPWSYTQYDFSNLIEGTKTAVVNYSVKFRCTYDGVTYESATQNYNKQGTLTGGGAILPGHASDGLFSMSTGGINGYTLWRTGVDILYVDVPSFTENVACTAAFGETRTFRVTVPSRRMVMHFQTTTTATEGTGEYTVPEGVYGTPASLYDPDGKLTNTACFARDVELNDHPLYDSVASSSWDVYSSSGASFSATAALRYSYAYGWATSDSGDVQATVSQALRLSFVRDSKTYSAAVSPPSSAASVRLGRKGTGDIAAGKDVTARGAVAFSAPAYSGTVVFSGPGGLSATARVNVPSASVDSYSGTWGGPLYVTAKAVYTNSTQEAGSKSSTETNAANVNENSAIVTIDPGLMSLYE